MTHTVLATFDRLAPVKIDRALVKKVMQYTIAFTRKNEDHINFFGGNLIGVYSVKWIKEDELLWMEDILHIADIEELRDDVSDLPNINDNFIVSSDVINLSFMWLAHKALNAKELTHDEKDKFVRSVLNMMQYKFISSLHTRRFKYKANMEVALAVYEQLTQKSMIKRCESWAALVDARTEDILDPHGVSYNAIKDFDKDEEIVRVINDIWCRTSSIIQLLTDDYYKMLESESRISTNKLFTTIDGTDILKNNTNKFMQIKTYMHDIIPDRNAFIKEDLKKVILQIVDTANPHFLDATLLYFVQNIKSKKQHELISLVDDILTYVFEIIRKEKMDIRSVPVITMKLKASFRSSRNANPLFISIKERMGHIVSDSNHRIDDGDLSSVRIAAMLYISVRALIVSS